MAQGEQAELSIKPDALIKSSRFPPVGFMNLWGIQPAHPCLHHSRKAPGIPIRPDALPLIPPEEGGCRRLRDFLWCVDQTLLSRRKRADADVSATFFGALIRHSCPAGRGRMPTGGKRLRLYCGTAFLNRSPVPPGCTPAQGVLVITGSFSGLFALLVLCFFIVRGYRVRGTTGVWNERGWDALLFREKEAKSFWEIPAESPHYGGLERFC